MSITGFRQRNRMKPIGTGYRLYDTFKSQVLPSIKNAIGQNRAYQEEGVDETRAFDMQQTQDAQDFTLKRDNLARIAEMQKEANKPMNIVFDNFDRISAKDKKAFELAERGLKIRDENLGDKLELDKLKQAETVRKNLATEGLNEQKVAIQRYKTEHPDVNVYEQKGGDALLIDKQGKIIGKIGPSGVLTEEGKIDKQTEATKEIEGVRQEGREDLATGREWSLGNIPDPNDPTKQIAVRINEKTGEVKPVELGGQNTGPISKPSARAGTLKQPANLGAIRASAQESLDLINNEILDEKGLLRPEVAATVGKSRMFGGHLIPTTEARKGNTALNRLSGRMIVDLIAEMKDQSRTGATGFGQLNLRELEVLKNAASKLEDKFLDEETYQNEILRIRDRLQQILLDEEIAADTSGPGGKPPLTADMVKSLISKYGGKK